MSAVGTSEPPGLAREMASLVTFEATQCGAPSQGAGVAHSSPTAPQQRTLLGRVTLTGALIAVAVMSGIYSAAFSAYWLILTLFALGGATQTWSFDLAASKPPTQAE